MSKMEKAQVKELQNYSDSLKGIAEIIFRLRTKCFYVIMQIHKALLLILKYKLCLSNISRKKNILMISQNF